MDTIAGGDLWIAARWRTFIGKEMRAILSDWIWVFKLLIGFGSGGTQGFSMAQTRRFYFLVFFEDLYLIDG